MNCLLLCDIAAAATRAILDMNRGQSVCLYLLDGLEILLDTPGLESCGMTTEKQWTSLCNITSALALCNESIECHCAPNTVRDHESTRSSAFVALPDGTARRLVPDFQSFNNQRGPFLVCHGTCP